MVRLIGLFLIAAGLLFSGPFAARAATADYVLEAVTAKVPMGKGAIIRVRLLNKTTGKPVPNAVIFQSRLDMSPVQMGEMAAPLTPLPASEPGVYSFKADLDMAGRWALKLAAKVPGEHETVRGEVVILAAR
jgi:hypothetical protein